MKNFKQRIVTHSAVLQSATDKFNALFDEPAEVAELEEPDFGLGFIPDLILVHNCVYPEVKACRCRKKVSYVDALKMARYGEAQWVQIVSATGANKVVPALAANAAGRVRRANVPNSGAAEALADVGLAKKQGRRADVSGLIEAAQAIQETAQNQEIIHTKGAAVGGVIQATTRTVLNAAGRLTVESRGTFDESSFPKMTGPPLQYKSKHSKTRELKRDKTGSEVADGDDYNPDGDP